jgi:hypothetical protein
MAWVEYPLVGDTPVQSIQVDLDEGQTFTLRFVWNSRSATWFVHLYDQEEVEHLAVTRLVAGYPLFMRELPGFFFAELAEPLKGEMADLGRYRLLYADATEVA